MADHSISSILHPCLPVNISLIYLPRCNLLLYEKYSRPLLPLSKRITKIILNFGEYKPSLSNLFSFDSSPILSVNPVNIFYIAPNTITSSVNKETSTSDVVSNAPYDWCTASQLEYSILPTRNYNILLRFLITCSSCKLAFCKSCTSTIRSLCISLPYDCLNFLFFYFSFQNGQFHCILYSICHICFISTCFTT